MDASYFLSTSTTLCESLIRTVVSYQEPAEEQLADDELFCRYRVPEIPTLMRDNIQRESLLCSSRLHLCVVLHHLGAAGAQDNIFDVSYTCEIVTLPRSQATCWSISILHQSKCLTFAWSATQRMEQQWQGWW